MDVIESQLQAKLQNWRSDGGQTEKHHERRKPKSKAVRKRSIKPTRSPVRPAPAATPSHLPNVVVSEDKMKECLSKTLLTVRPSTKWASPSRERTAELGIVKKRKKKQSTNTRTRDASTREDPVNAAAYVERHRFEVGALGSAALQKRQRKAYESATLLRLGCRAPKNQKLPIGTLVGMRKKKKERHVKEREKKREEGLYTQERRERSKRALRTGLVMQTSLFLQKRRSSKEAADREAEVDVLDTIGTDTPVSVAGRRGRAPSIRRAVLERVATSSTDEGEVDESELIFESAEEAARLLDVTFQ
eukprot:IDg3435t1